jgi:hypothetical protein
MDDVPIGSKAVLAGVLAHGRHANPVGKDNGTELKGRKKNMTHEFEIGSKGADLSKACL